MAASKQPRRYQRHKGTNALFLDWKPLNPRGLPLDFRTAAQIPWPITPPDRLWQFDPWTVNLARNRWWRAPYLLPAFGAQEVALNQNLIESQPAYSLLALQILQSVGVQIPLWLQETFSAAVEALEQHRCGSLDSAFGHFPIHKSALAAARDQRTKAHTAHFYVVQGILAGRALDNELFDEVGAKLGIGKDKTRALATLVESRVGSSSLTHWRDMPKDPVEAWRQLANRKSVS